VAERETLTWQVFGDAGRELAARVAADDYRPDIILAIARGGLFVAGALAYALSIKNLYVINVEYYTGVGERLDFPVVLPPPLALVDLEAARVLIADDVADTGATLEVVRDHCARQVAQVRCAVLYQKPGSRVDCDYVWRRTDRWINFPWSTQPPIVALERDGRLRVDA
jgi:hypoxanthine phosphoribosyltransferase